MNRWKLWSAILIFAFLTFHGKPFLVGKAKADKQSSRRENIDPQDLQAGKQQGPGPDLQAGELLGRAVVTAGGTKIGKVETLVSENGRLKYLVVAGDKDLLHPIPVEYVQKDDRSGELVVNLTEKRLEQAPSFHKGNWPDITAREFDQRIFAFYSGKETGLLAQADPQPGRPGTFRNESTPEALTVQARVVGNSVMNFQGERLGSVQEVVTSPAGDIQYIVVSHGGIIGIGNGLTPIPWEAVEYQPQKDVVLVDIDREKLKNAPRFAGDKPGPGMEPGWEEKVRAYYGLEVLRHDTPGGLSPQVKTGPPSARPTRQ